MAITFNEAYYLQSNADVATAVSLGFFKSGLDHFNKIGARELRSPNAVFDAKYYATQNPDVLAAVSAGTFASVYDHYVKFGLAEGRAPNASLKGFDAANYLATYADLAKGGVTAATALAHYVQFGVDEGRNFTSSTAGAVTGNYAGTTGDDIVTPAGNQTSAIRVEGGQQKAAGDTLVITSGSAASFQTIDLSNNADQNQTRDNSTGNNTGNKIGPVVQGFENIDARQATINMNLTALDRTSITNTDGVASAQTGSVLQGGTGRDTLTGGNGADVLSGGDGNDSVTAGAGNDTIDGGNGNDTIFGGAGADVITDGAGDDSVNGDAGADVINVGSGTNFIDGGSDNDTITLKADQATATTVSTIQGGSGNDTIVLNDAAITAASRVSVTGGVGNDTVIAGLGVETINGGAGNDTIRLSQANIGTGDVFNGNDGQDILQLEIPTGSGTNTYTFAPTTAGQFSGFEAIALIDSSTNTSAKSYKIILTDNFVANNLVSGSFLIDARGLPGGSNVVIDFSALTSASAALFATGAFRVLASPSTDVRDQNNVTITNTYTVNTSNSALSATAAFNIYAGETSIVAGSEAAYTTDRLVATGTGQAAYTTIGGSVETIQNSGSSFDFVINTAGATLTNSFNSNTQPNNSTVITGSGTLTSASNSISVPSGATLVGTTIVDITSGDGDRLDATLVTAVVPTAIAGIETINLTSYAAGGIDLSTISGATSINITGQSFAGTKIANGQSLNLANISTGGSVTFNTTNTGATIASATLNLNNVVTSLQTGLTNNITTLNLVATGASTLSLADKATNNGGAGTISVSGTGSVTFNDSDVSGAATVITSSTAAITYNQLAAHNTKVTGGSAADTFSFNTAGTLTNNDTIDGGAGTDTLTTSGYTATNDLANVTSVEVINLTGANLSYSYTTVDANVASGQTLTVNASGATGTSTLVWNGAAETNGVFNVTGTANNDTLTGGFGNDTIIGGAGADRIAGASQATGGTAATGGIQADVFTGGAGVDTFVFSGSTLANMATVSSGTTAITRITDFVAGTDKIALVNGAAAQTSVVLATAQTITTAADLTAVWAGITAIGASTSGGATNAVVVTVSGGAAAGTYLYVNDATAAVNSATDMLINITGVTGTLSASDFVFA